jgi:hypothetical protein
MPWSTGIEITTELSAEELRLQARVAMSRRAGFVLPAIANVLEGLARAEAGRQALSDAIKRSNVGGLDGLYDRQKSGRSRHLNARRESERRWSRHRQSFRGIGYFACLVAPLRRQPGPQARRRYRIADGNRGRAPVHCSVG